MLHSLLNLDTELLIWARSLIHPEYALWVQIFAESIVIFVMILLVSLWLSGVLKKNTTYKTASLKIFFTIVLVFVIYGIINLGLPQWRMSPQDISGGISALIPRPSDNSFPSGHALFSGAFLVGLWKYFRNMPILVAALFFTLLTVCLRVIAGVHYPGDIIGGWFFGVIGAILLEKIIESEFMSKKIYPLCLQIAQWIHL